MDRKRSGGGGRQAAAAGAYARCVRLATMRLGRGLTAGSGGRSGSPLRQTHDHATRMRIARCVVRRSMRPGRQRGRVSPEQNAPSSRRGSRIGSESTLFETCSNASERWLTTLSARRFANQYERLCDFSQPRPGRPCLQSSASPVGPHSPGERDTDLQIKLLPCVHRSRLRLVGHAQVAHRSEDGRGRDCGEVRPKHARGGDGPHDGHCGLHHFEADVLALAVAVEEEDEELGALSLLREETAGERWASWREDV